MTYPILCNTRSVDVLDALLDCGADPNKGCSITPLCMHIIYGRHDMAARLLQDPRVRGSVDSVNISGQTPLHYVCLLRNEDELAIVPLFLQAGANPLHANRRGDTPLSQLQKRHSSHPVTLALLNQAIDAERASLLVKARRLIIAATSKNVVAPFFVQARVALGHPLPSVALAPTADIQNDEEARKLRSTLAFLCGVGGAGMPRDVFRVVLNMLMPLKDPLRRKGAGMRSAASV